MNELIMLQITDEMIKIIDNLRKRDWIVSNFSGNPDLYNPLLFIKDRNLYKTKFTFLLDRNILHYVFVSNKKLKSSEVRDAIGFMAFCQLADIELDISLAIHELFHDGLGMERAHIEIERFLQIDDSNRIELENYATNKTDKFTINKKEVTKSKQQISNWYKKYKIETNLENYYLIVLKTVHIFSFDKEQNNAGFTHLIDWMQKEFGYSTIGLAYALNIFRKKKFPKTMKYKKTDTIEQRKSELMNMTWDLYVMYEFIRRLNNKEEDTEYLLVSADKFLRTVLKTAISIYSSESVNSIKKLVDIEIEDYPMIDYFNLNYNTKDTNRAFNKLTNKEEKNKYKKDLIKDLEIKLLS